MNQYVKSERPFGLSGKEMDVINALFLGAELSKIAKFMGVSPKTVSTYKHRAFKKMQVKTIMAAYHKLNPLRHCSLCQAALEKIDVSQ